MVRRARWPVVLAAVLVGGRAAAHSPRQFFAHQAELPAAEGPVAVLIPRDAYALSRGTPVLLDLHLDERENLLDVRPFASLGLPRERVPDAEWVAVPDDVFAVSADARNGPDWCAVRPSWRRSTAELGDRCHVRASFLAPQPIEALTLTFAEPLPAGTVTVRRNDATPVRELTITADGSNVLRVPVGGFPVRDVFVALPWSGRLREVRGERAPQVVVFRASGRHTLHLGPSLSEPGMPHRVDEERMPAFLGVARFVPNPALAEAPPARAAASPAWVGGGVGVVVALLAVAVWWVETRRARRVR